MELNNYEQGLLSGWEDVFKKGQLTIWIMLSLKDGPKHMTEIKKFIEKATKGALTADDQSMYRALRRYNDAELIDFTNQPGDGGPERKIYQLTETGSKVLAAFVERNIINIFFSNQTLIEKCVKGN